MLLLTPKFVFVAILASLTAFSLAPPADAAAIAMRRSHQQHISDSSEAWSNPSSSHLNHPVLPLPARLTSASGKQTQDRSGESSRSSMKRQNPRDFFASRRRSLTPDDLPPLLTRRDTSHHKSHQPHEHGSPPATPAQQSTEEGSGSKPYVQTDGVNNHVALGRRTPGPFPDPHNHHDHHHHHHGSKQSEDVLVIEGDNENIHIGGRSPLPDPRHHHHHHHDHHDDHHWRSFGGNDMSSAKEDGDLGRRSPDPRHDRDRHHHHGHGHHKEEGVEKVIIKGDDNDVSVHTRSRIARHQRLDHSPAHSNSENGFPGGHQHQVHARKYIPRHQPHQGGERSSDRQVEHSKSPQRDDRDRTEKNARSVLINSVEGEEKYLVPDDYQDQRVTVIEGDGVSQIVKRGDPGIEGVRGSIEIMSQSAMSEAGQRIASLVLVEPDSAMSEFGNDTFILNASEMNRTELYMVALNTTDSGVQGDDVPVALKVPMFNPDSASIEGYCATYDPQPPAPAPLSVERCFYDEPTGPHKSQVFAYTPSTSVIRPMWFSGETDSEDSVLDSGSNSTMKPDGVVDPKTPLNEDMTSVTRVGDFGNSTAPPPSVASLDNSTGIDRGLTGTGSGSGNDSTIPNAEDFAAKAQNVTLIFSPVAPIIPSGSRTSMEDEVPTSDTNRTSTDTSTSPFSGGLNGTETDRTGSLDDAGLPMPLSQSVPSETVSPAVAIPSGSSTSEGDDKDLNVMVGVARGQERSSMKAVDTAPYNWRFDRERS